MITISEESIDSLSEHSNISIAFEYDCIYQVSTPDSGQGGILLTLTALPEKQNKNYDACEGASPDNWSKTFDTTNWGYIVARDADKRIGGAVIAYNTDRVNILDGRSDLAVLWDIRIDPAYRQHGVGHKLFAAVEDWARDRHCKQLKIETQNINVAACRFYARQGCTLGAINRFAYPGLPHEAQLIWYKDL